MHVFGLRQGIFMGCDKEDFSTFFELHIINLCFKRHGLVQSPEASKGEHLMKRYNGSFLVTSHSCHLQLPQIWLPLAV